MTLLSVIELAPVVGGRVGRVMGQRDALAQRPIAELEADFSRQFQDEDDERRLADIQQRLEQGGLVEVHVHPGEGVPPEHHAFLKFPGASERRLFACVLAPMAVVRQMIEQAPYLVFESATFQVIEDDSSPAALQAGIQRWFRRLWPALPEPAWELHPWPDTEVRAALAGALPLRLVPPPGAPQQLNEPDYPLPEELAS